MFTISSVKVKALSLAAAIAVAGSSMAQSPKNKPLTGSGNGKSATSGSGFSLIKPPIIGQMGVETKPTTTTDPKAPKGGSGHSILDPFLPLGPGQIHDPKGPKGGVNTDPVSPPKGGNDTVPPTHVHPTIDPLRLLFHNKLRQITKCCAASAVDFVLHVIHRPPFAK